MKNLKQKVDSYIIANNMRKTPERDKLIFECEKMEIFDVMKLREFARKNEIPQCSVYNFVNLLVKIDIINIQERYVWNPEKKY